MCFKRNDEINRWRVKKEYLQKVNINEAKFVFEHAEKVLQDTLDTNKIIVDKSTTLLTLTVGIMAALVGFSVERWTDNLRLDPFILSSILVGILLLIISILFSLNIRPIKYYVSGSRPEVFFCENFFSTSIKEQDRELFFYINEIEEYQKRIIQNRETNNSRWKLFRIAYGTLILAPLVFVITFLLFA